MTVLVTGAAGFLGSHTSERLLAEGVDVVGLDVFDDLYDPIVKQANLVRSRSFDRFELRVADIRDAEALAGLPPRIEAVVHFAALAAARRSLGEPSRYRRMNVGGTRTLLRWARERGVPAFVFASSSSVYGDRDALPFRESEPLGRPLSPYAATKRAGERLCEAAATDGGPTIAALRYFTAFGPRQRPDLAVHKFARRIRCGDPVPLLGDGSSSRDYTYVDDVVSGTLAALEWARRGGGGARAFNVGSGRGITLSRMVAELGEAMGVRPKVEHHPAHPGDLLATRADVTRAASDLGYTPTGDFTRGVRRFVEWFDRQAV